MLDGYQPGDPVVAVFTYQADPAGRTAEQIADEAFDIFNDHPRDPTAQTWPAPITGAGSVRCRSATSWSSVRSRWRSAGLPAGSRSAAL
jgi:hypothetical protein